MRKTRKSNKKYKKNKLKKPTLISIKASLK